MKQFQPLLFSAALLFLAACGENTQPEAAAPSFNFSIDPGSETVNLTRPDAAALSTLQLGACGPDDPRILFPDEELALTAYNALFLPGNILEITAEFTNVTGFDFEQPFTFTRAESTSNIVSSQEPEVTDASLGGDGVLSPDETTSTMTFTVEHMGQPFSYYVFAEAVVRCGDVDPTDPTDATDPTDPTDATDPTDPTDPTDATDPTDPTDATDPTDPTDATDPTDPTDATDPTAPLDPPDLDVSKTVSPIDPSIDGTGTIDYNVTVTNTGGSAAENFILVDTFTIVVPLNALFTVDDLTVDVTNEGVDEADCTVAPLVEGGNVLVVTCVLGELAAGATLPLDFTFNYDIGGGLLGLNVVAVVNAAVASTTSLDPILSNNTAQVEASILLDIPLLP